MGMLFQFGALFTDISVFDNVAYQMREHTDLPEELIRDMVLLKLNAVGLRGAHHLMPAELSGGMARRVALARAIALDPMLIMYDEPFAGLDPISLGVIGQLIRQLNDALGATTIMVTHDIQESLLIVDFIYFMSEGKIVALGTPDEIRASRHPFVHQFVFAEADGPVPFHYPAAPLNSGTAGERRKCALLASVQVLHPAGACRSWSPRQCCPAATGLCDPFFRRAAASGPDSPSDACT
jgi:phospholipid/cholesterol/gamma-HCH transport system ATP-binding protein